ncbi:hypothetical protein MCOR27_011233 [Pyricularia oryzae]|uniref:Uncharacterized protein n=1 Tax=Pyricularia grisea TaxID=148305 RepID=A0ABQ8N210_PYRGI|nr:hypothetical protein MCOR01_009348 [Pyricularia oryzae]KAI6289907.1 hypothetical protein MCOR33_011651 [Pyricularia grisea]KAI6251733.1 hypothetical protein MCOR19_011634 [Pyricularia oryzae]KAI6265892.1 hypothetical protein MCOR27_011233 [Pyricularia oryzae]KAI6280497.1 hypothetical protein MCOR26_003739 [Pyricularia oryzae]
MPWTSPVQQLAKQSARLARKARLILGSMAFTAVELYPRDERVRRRDRPFVITTTTPASSTTLTATMAEVHE